jgi:ParB family chromosome partitioning protein
MGKQRNALGNRGLATLLSDYNEEKSGTVAAAATDYEVGIDKIKANVSQPRTSFDDASLEELAESIKVHGIIQPLTLRKLSDDEFEFEIISGERRYRAAKLAGLTSVPAYIRVANDSETLEMALIENIQREDLNAMEIAITYNRLMDECSLTQEELSARVGKKRATVANYLRLLTLEDEVQQVIKQGLISMGHARALAGLTDAKLQRQLAQRIVSEELSVRQIEEIIKNLSDEKPQKQSSPKNNSNHDELPDNFCVLLELLESKFNSKIAIRRNRKGDGSIVINFASDREIDEFIKKLSK